MGGGSSFKEGKGTSFGALWEGLAAPGLAERLLLLLSHLPRPLPEQHVPLTVISHAFTLPLNLSRIVIRFSPER